MKKAALSFLLLAISLSSMALSRSKVREYARFLSDRMAYELGLTSMQYDDCYEINYDFVDGVGDILNGVAWGNSYALDKYYMYLDYRNEDLSYVLTSSQYARFIATECLYRPFCVYDGNWAFRPYMVYSNRSYFYMSIPMGYNAYRGGHARRYYSVGFYIGRYNHGPRYEFAPIRNARNFRDIHRHDFGPVRSGHVGERPQNSPRRQERRSTTAPSRSEQPRSVGSQHFRQEQARPQQRQGQQNSQQPLKQDQPQSLPEQPQRQRTEQSKPAERRQERTQPQSRSQQQPQQRQEQSKPVQQRQQQSKSTQPQTTQSKSQQSRRQGGGGAVRQGRR